MRVSVQESGPHAGVETAQYQGLVLRTWSSVHCGVLSVCVQAVSLTELGTG